MLVLDWALFGVIDNKRTHAFTDNIIKRFDVRTTGPKADCLTYVDAVWTDMRPLSLRRAMAEDASA